MDNKLYNGIEISADWPPQTTDFKSTQPQRVPYLEKVPTVLPIDIGRQLFVDDFLVDFQGTTMSRHFHQPVKDPNNPIFFPQTKDELNPESPPCAVPKCGGVWYDYYDKCFKMWYMTSYVGNMGYATSQDGIHWERPELDVVPGTNLCLPRDLHPDSGSVIIDYESSDPSQRYKMLLREPNPPGKGHFPACVLTSPDGIHWEMKGKTTSMDDRSTMFYNPFRRKWVQSIRCWKDSARRSRMYWEDDDFLKSADWSDGKAVCWLRADSMDQGIYTIPELYNVDAIAYESLMLGFFQILKGPPNGICDDAGMPKLTELTLGYSRDSFHWSRPDRRAFIGARRELGSWEYGYVESSAGMCHIVGDELWFYYSAYAGDPTRTKADWRWAGTYSNGAMGLAKLRRDGFASMRSCFAGSTLLTRPVTFSGSHLFVNVNTVGSCFSAEVLDDSGKAIDGFGFEDCRGFIGNSTSAEICWKNKELSLLKGKPVKIRFKQDRGDFYSFWISSSANGESNGYTAAGGPGLSGPVDC